MNITRPRRSLSVLTVTTLLAGAACAWAAAPAETDRSGSVGAAISDTAITAKVKTRLATDQRIKGSDIDVTTNNAVVTLTGSASSSDAKQAAQTLAGNVSGVHAVNNQLSAPSMSSELGEKARHATQKTATAVSDTAITADLKTKFATDRATKGSDLSVETSHAVVAVSGTVTSESQKAHIIDVARHTKGVAQVDSTALNVAGD